MSGDDVYFLQAALYDLGYLEDEPDGSYGFYTMDAVAGFQADNGLEVTGDADAQVLFLLFGGGYGSAGSDEDSDEDYTEEQTQKHEPVSSNASLGQSIVDYAMGYIGVTPYVHAGNSLEEGTDCSGFVSLIFADFGIYAPRGSDDYQDMGNIDYEDLLPGDVVVYRYGGHVAIYAGDDMIVHCSNPETGTVYSDMWYDEPTAYVRLVF